MATVHWATNKGLLGVAQGDWDDEGATDIRIGLLEGTARPAGIDSLAEVADVNFVTDLLAITDVDEITVSGYSRQNLSRTNAAEDDTNDRVNMDTSNVTFSALAAGESIIGWFVFEFVTDDTDSPVWSVGLLDAPGIPTNGSDITLSITDLYRLSAV